MKNQYIIVRYVDKDIVEEKGCADTLYYNEFSKSFVCMENYATKYTNKRVAAEDMRWANKYGTSLRGKSEIVKL